jgi:hypothetical protein
MAMRWEGLVARIGENSLRFSSMYATRPAHLIPFDLIILIVVVGRCKL